MKQQSIELEIYPPFSGFPKEGIKFLKDLKRNNNRTWFAKHKSEYESFVKFPMQCLVDSLKTPVSKFAPEIDINPKRNIFRIYRDTRFSKDKTPYKTHIAAVFHLKGGWQNSAGFYIEISFDGIYVGGGFYMPNSSQLKRIRMAIVENAKEFISIIDDSRFVKRFGTIQGEKLKRIPVGFTDNHFMGEWLKYKQFYAGVEWKTEECLNEKFISKVVSVYKDIYPLVKFLNRAVGKGV